MTFVRIFLWLAALVAAIALASKLTGALAARANRRRRPPAGALPLPADDLTVEADDGARLVVSVEGRGPDVLLLHGWAADRSIWNETAAALVAAGRRVIRYDMRGHGRSTLGSGDLSIGRLIADLEAVLATTALANAVVVGHSLGSLTALVHLCGKGDAAAGARLRAAVFAGIGVPDTNFRGAVQGVSEWAMRSPTIEWLIAREQFGLRMMDSFAAERVPAHVRAQRANFLATPADVRSRLLATVHHDFLPALARYRTPTTLFVGSHDHYAVPARVHRLAELLPEARCVELPGCGHNLPFEAPRILADAALAAGR